MASKRAKKTAIEEGTFLGEYQERGINIPFIGKDISSGSAAKLKKAIDLGIQKLHRKTPSFVTIRRSQMTDNRETLIGIITHYGYRPRVEIKGANRDTPTFNQKRVSGRGPTETLSSDFILSNEDLQNFVTILTYLDETREEGELAGEEGIIGDPTYGDPVYDEPPVEGYYQGPESVFMHEPQNIGSDPRAMHQFLGEAPLPSQPQKLPHVIPADVGGAGEIRGEEGGRADPQRGTREFYEIADVEGIPAQVHGLHEQRLTQPEMRREKRQLNVRPLGVQGFNPSASAALPSGQYVPLGVQGGARVSRQTRDALSGYSARDVGRVPFFRGPTQKQLQDLEAELRTARQNLDQNRVINEMIQAINRSPINEPNFVPEEYYTQVVNNRFATFHTYNLEHCAKNEANTRRQEIQKRMALQEEYDKDFRIPLAPDRKIKSYVR